MSAAHLDLNLLKVVDAVLSTGSVTEGAKVAGLTQPAASRALSRARAMLNDELLVRSGRALLETPYASALRPRLHQALNALTDAIPPAEPFDPATSRRRFRIATTDYGVAVLIPALLERLAREAPWVDLVVVPQQEGSDEALADGALDALVMPHRKSTRGLVWTRLISDQFVCVLRRGHPALRGKWTVERYCSLSHVFVAPLGQARSAIDERLAKAGLQRRVAVQVPSFLAAPVLVAGSDLVATMAARAAAPLLEALRLVTRPLPFDTPPVTVSLAWHERTRKDPGHRWFREILKTLSPLLRSPARV